MMAQLQRSSLGEQKDTYTEDDYFQFEETAFGRWEYVGGDVRMMAGGTDDHNTIVSNLSGTLRAAMLPRRCRVYAADMKVHTGDGINTYPDVAIVCGPRRYHRGRTDILLNPLLIVEVLSESTEAYERGEKWDHYRTIPALADYLLVSQHEPCVFHYSLHGDHWEFREFSGLSSSIPSPSVETTLALADVYALLEREQTESQSDENRGRA